MLWREGPCPRPCQAQPESARLTACLLGFSTCLLQPRRPRAGQWLHWAILRRLRLASPQRAHTAPDSPFQLGVQSCHLQGGFLQFSHQLAPLTVQLQPEGREA